MCGVENRETGFLTRLSYHSSLDSRLCTGPSRDCNLRRRPALHAFVAVPPVMRALSTRISRFFPVSPLYYHAVNVSFFFRAKRPRVAGNVISNSTLFHSRCLPWPHMHRKKELVTFASDLITYTCERMRGILFVQYYFTFCAYLFRFYSESAPGLASCSLRHFLKQPRAHNLLLQS